VTLPAGTKLGPYEIQSALGAGGMGEVYKARDSRLNRLIALKLLPAGAAGDAERRERFEREAQAIAALNHPNIVTIHSVEPADGQFFLTMELVEGRPLADVMPSNGLPLERLLTIAIAVVDAVAAAHQKGITHRDIKPANIMIGEGEQAGRIKVLDFGLAKLADAPLAAAGVTGLPTKPITADGRILGTVAYMSPEQAEGKPIDARSDLFSLGVILYEMATGQRPFGGDTSISIISSIIKDTPSSVTELKPSLPRDLGRIVRRALLKDPERRYQTAKDLRSDLEELKASLDSGEIVAHSAAGASSSTPHGRQTRPWMVAAAASVATLVIAGGLYLWTARHAQPAPQSTAAPSALDDLQITQLTTSGNAQRPAISPDGKYVAYVQRDGSDYSLWIRQTATASNVHIAASEPDFTLADPTVTPDGNYVDYVKRRERATGELWRVPFLGGSPKRVVDKLSTTVGWSPDGRRMAFIRAEIGAAAISTDLVVADADGSHERVLTTRHLPIYFPSLANSSSPIVRPSWPFDGKSIAVLGIDTSAGRIQAQIVIVDVASGMEHVVPLDGELKSVGWLSRDALVVSRRADLGQPIQLWRVSYADGKLSRLTNDLNDYAGIDLTADRTSLVTSQSDTRVGVWVGDASATAFTEAVSPARGGRDVAWASDRLLYTTFVNRTPAIMALVPGRGTPEEIVRDGAAPAVTVDGRTMVFEAVDADDRMGSLWKADVDGSHRVRLVSDYALGAVVTNGDRQVVYVSLQSGQQSLWIVPLAGGSPRQLSPVFASAPDVAPNGTTLLFASRDSRGGVPLLMCELPDCAPRPIARPANFGGLPHWMPAGRAVAYADTARFNLWTASLDGGPPRQFTHFNDGRTITAFAWSRDGKRLAIARSMTTDDIVLFKGLKR